MRLWISLMSLFLGACTSTGTLHLSSAPPGARIFIDGVDSGFTTPVVLTLDDAPGRTVEFRLQGYEPAQRTIVDEREGTLVYWSESSVYYNTWNFPLWLPAADLFLFYKRPDVPRVDRAFMGRIFVRLQRSTDRQARP